MVALAILHDGPVPDEGAEADGLLDYLRTLYRVAHASGASHWCTPGHNRGQALRDDAALAQTPIPRLFSVGEEVR